MANMFKPSKATSVTEYKGMLVSERREIIDFLDKFIQEVSPKYKPYFAYNMIGYGKFPYLNYKKEMIDWPIVALASQKNYVSVYVCSVDNGEYVAEKFKSELGKVSVGKSCIRFKKLEDLNLDTLKKVLKIAAGNPGLR